MEPIISVKIPTYNCANYLIQTIASVLNQKDFDLDLLDIEVIDDYSTLDDPESVVKQYGKNRVKFYQNSKNIGAVNTFNTCIERSNCKFIHILHGDDFILEGYYNEIVKLIKQNENCALYATRSFYANEYGVYTGISAIIDNLKFGSNNIDSFLYNNPLQFCSIVLRRDYFSKFPKFDTNLIHTADLDMWANVVYNSNGIVSDEVLAVYRIFEGNDTSKLKKSAENLYDLVRLSNKFQTKFKDVFSVKKFNYCLLNITFIQANLFYHHSDINSFTNNFKFFFKYSSFLSYNLDKLKLIVKYMSLVLKNNNK
jgi:glycosyltransferase involved in cell wall biosynthesis